LIDLRSDTVTKPSSAMRQAMMQAEVGDDVFGEDPTVNRLQEMVADLLGKEAALFVPSGTMGNEVCLKALTQPGDEVICEAGCHFFNYESGAPGLLAGVVLRPLVGTRGVITAEQVAAAINPPVDHFAPSRVVAVENTHNSAGGTVFPLSEIERLRQLADERGLKMHLDGARLWNASVASGVPLSEFARPFDSVSVCFSKGLGAPVGSAVAGSRDFIAAAHRYRKAFGGGMRQVGILAAACIYALEHNLKRLAEDHANARWLAEELASLPGLNVDLDRVETNIVLIDIAPSGRSTEEVLADLRREGVLLVPFGPTTLRAVTHLDVDREDIERAVDAFRRVFS
jgi:threonine aldolase